MINIAICDDESHTLNAIAKVTESAIITCNFDAEIAIATTNQQLIYEKIKNHEIDVLFLDVDFNNNGVNGIEFALELRKQDKNFKLIFVTSHFEYAMIAYKCKTYDYILKPFDKDKVCNIIKRLMDDVSDYDLGLIKLNKDDTIRTKDILFIERNKSKATVYTKNSTYETCFSLNSIHQELPPSFVRVHRSYIVNQDRITHISKDEKSIYFEDNKCCPLGQFNLINKGSDVSWNL